MHIHYGFTRDDGPVLELYSRMNEEFALLRDLAASVRAGAGICEVSDHLELVGGRLKFVCDEGLVHEKLTANRTSYKLTLSKDEWKIFAGLVEPFINARGADSFQWMTGRNASYLAQDDEKSMVISFNESNLRPA